MLTQLLNLTRPLVVCDCETTGLDVQTCRIVEIAFQVYYPDSSCALCKQPKDAHPHASLGGPGMGPVPDHCVEFQSLKEWRTLINPGVPISAEVSAIHGITDAMVNACQRCSKRHGIPTDLLRMSDEQRAENCACEEFKPWPTFKQLAASLAKGFTDVDFAGQNCRFDLRILDAEMRRVGQQWSYGGARVIDSKMLEQLAEPRSLSHLYKKYTGQDHDGAHGALADVRASSVVIAAQLARTDIGGEIYMCLPRDLDALHEAQWPGWLCDGGEFRMQNGVAVCQFGKWRGKSMRSIEASYWDWILSSTFPEDVRALARNAKLGKFP